MGYGFKANPAPSGHSRTFCVAPAQLTFRNLSSRSAGAEEALRLGAGPQVPGERRSWGSWQAGPTAPANVATRRTRARSHSLAERCERGRREAAGAGNGAGLGWPGSGAKEAGC